MTEFRFLTMALSAFLAFAGTGAHAEPAAVKVGDPLPHFDLLQPGVHRYLRYAVRGSARTAIDIWSRRITFEDKDGVRLLHIVQRWDEVAPPASLVQDSWFEPGTLRPLSHVKVITRDGKAQTGGYQFLSDRISGMPDLPDNVREGFSIASPEPAYNFEYDMELLQTLPLAAGYAVSIMFYDPGAEPPARYTFRVAGSERITGSDGTPIECWLVTADYNTGKVLSRFWFDKRSQILVREEQTAPDGTYIVKVLLPPEAADGSLHRAGSAPQATRRDAESPSQASADPT